MGGQRGANMLERIEKLQVLTVGLLVVLGILIGTKTLITAFSGNTISVTGSAYEIVKSDSGTLSFNINVKRSNKNGLVEVTIEAYNQNGELVLTNVTEAIVR